MSAPSREECPSCRGQSIFHNCSFFLWGQHRSRDDEPWLCAWLRSPRARGDGSGGGSPFAGLGGQDQRHSSPPEGLVSSIGQSIILEISGQVLTLVYHLNKLVILFRLTNSVLLFWCEQICFSSLFMCEKGVHRFRPFHLLRP